MKGVHTSCKSSTKKHQNLSANHLPPQGKKHPEHEVLCSWSTVPTIWEGRVANDSGTNTPVVNDLSTGPGPILSMEYWLVNEGSLPIKDRSMVYLPTGMVDFYGKCR